MFHSRLTWVIRELAASEDWLKPARKSCILHEHRGKYLRWNERTLSTPGLCRQRKCYLVDRSQLVFADSAVRGTCADRHPGARLGGWWRQGEGRRECKFTPVGFHSRHFLLICEILSSPLLSNRLFCKALAWKTCWMRAVVWGFRCQHRGGSTFPWNQGRQHLPSHQRRPNTCQGTKHVSRMQFLRRGAGSVCSRTCAAPVLNQNQMGWW